MLREKLIVDPSLVKRIPLNTCTVDELGRILISIGRWPKRLLHIAIARTVRGYGCNLNCILMTDSIQVRLAPYLLIEIEQVIPRPV